MIAPFGGRCREAMRSSVVRDQFSQSRNSLTSTGTLVEFRSLLLRHERALSPPRSGGGGGRSLMG
jgi:hypothetical protein